LIVDRVTVSLFAEHCYLVGCEETGRCVLIDPGAEPEKILRMVSASGLVPVKILNTHGHLDHIGAVEEMKRTFGIPFAMGREDEFLLRMAPDHARYFGVPPIEVPVIDEGLDGGERIEVGKLTIEVIATPGHTPGGRSYRVLDQVFTGDTLFEGSVGRVDLPGGDWRTLLASIRDRLLSLPDGTAVHPGHGEATTIGRERAANPFLRGAGA
jgi:glyoxylase-like metal-dependent hydrolase (beta-lactamase superfamily II)